MQFDEASNKVIGCAIEVHRHLGPGLLETSYEQCLAHELSLAGVRFKTQVPIPVKYKAVALDCCFRADFVVEDRLIVELKAVDKLQGIHEAQLLTYLKLAGIRAGLLVNFNVVRLRDGLKRFVL